MIDNEIKHLYKLRKEIHKKIKEEFNKELYKVKKSLGKPLGKHKNVKILWKN